MLLLDLGNTRLKWRLRDGPVHASAAGNYASLLAILEPGMSAWLASTAPAAMRDELLSLLASYSVVPRQVVARDHWRGLRLAYPAPESLGVDRWLGMLAARRRCSQRPVIVLSGGTALTADAVSADGAHLGGYIAPGPAAAAASLPAALSPLAAVGSIVPGRCTRDCVAGGYSSLYVGALALWRRQFALPDAELFLTGGDSHRLALWCQALGWIGVQYPDLVLEGLALAADGSGGNESFQN